MLARCALLSLVDCCQRFCTRSDCQSDSNNNTVVIQVRLLLLAALSQEHILYIGPPGTAKSELGRRLSRLCAGTFFERLLTRFSVPEVALPLQHRLCQVPCQPHRDASSAYMTERA